MLKNFGNLISETQKWLGYTVLDETTDIPLSLVKTFLNDTIRETESEFNFSQVQTPVLLPFLHTMTNVQGAYLSGVSVTPVAGSGISATILPYPLAGGNSLLVNNTVLSSYSGINFVGVDTNGTSYSGVSVIGNSVRGPLPNVMGFTYELPSDVEQIYGVTIPTDSIKLRFCPQYDWDRAVPQGLTIASGVPAYYTTFPGISASGNLVLQFYPQPVLTQFSGSAFQVHYKRKHQDMVALTDQQSMFPEQFQDIIIEGALEKCYAFLSDDKSIYHGKRKDKRIEDLQTWAENNLDYTYIARDADFLSTNVASAFNTSILFRL